MAATTATGVPNGLPTETAATVTPPSIHSSLYVGDLDRDVEERALFELFSQVSSETTTTPASCIATERTLSLSVRKMLTQN